MRRIALVGFGAIGRSIAERLCSTERSNTVLVGVLMRGAQSRQKDHGLPPHVVVTDNLDELMRTEPDAVVEAAGHVAVAEIAPRVLQAGCDLYLLSTGALADDALSKQLSEGASRGRGRIVIPSGALAGFDGLLALREMGLTAVSYRSVKPVRAWRGTVAEGLFDLETLDRRQVIFSGSAREAALAFPKNANLAVAVALAGVGLDATLVELVADPAAQGNSGEVLARANGARLELRLSGSGFASNPKSSQITALSVIAALTNYAAVIRYQ